MRNTKSKNKKKEKNLRLENILLYYQEAQLYPPNADER